MQIVRFLFTILLTGNLISGFTERWFPDGKSSVMELHPARLAKR